SALGTFDERAVAARDHAHDHCGRNAEGRWALGGVEDAEAAGCAGAYIDEPAFSLKRRDHEIDGARDLLPLPAHHTRDAGVLGIHDVHDTETRGGVDALRARVALLCGSGVAKIVVCHGGELDDKITNAKDPRDRKSVV